MELLTRSRIYVLGSLPAQANLRHILREMDTGKDERIIFGTPVKKLKRLAKIRYCLSTYGSAIAATMGNLPLLSLLMKKPNASVLFSLRRNAKVNRLMNFFSDRKALYQDKL